ncbi:hypothetical protein ACHAWU_008282 [Discostella pseudostelligera]|uniref:Uncharacterized protein n=1 Tax=Discostella pseudostelligera TaxID=259834 RepID=A0ABD3M6L8_9STRA
MLTRPNPDKRIILVDGRRISLSSTLSLTFLHSVTEQQNESSPLFIDEMQMMSNTGDEDPYDPDAAAELFFAQQRAREEAQSKLPTDDWIRLIMLKDAKIKMKKGNDGTVISTFSSPPESFMSRLVTTMPPPPLNNADGMIVLNTSDTFFTSTNAADAEDGEGEMQLTPGENAARRRIMEVLVQQLEEEMMLGSSKKESTTVEFA